MLTIKNRNEKTVSLISVIYWISIDDKIFSTIFEIIWFTINKNPIHNETMGRLVILMILRILEDK